MTRQPATRLLLWHQILLLVALLTLSLTACLLLATYRTMSGLEAEIETDGNAVLVRETEEFLGALAQEHARTLDARLARAQLIAELAGAMLGDSGRGERGDPTAQATVTAAELARMTGRGTQAYIVSSAGALFTAPRGAAADGEAVLRQVRADLDAAPSTARPAQAVWGAVHTSLFSEKRDVVVDAISPIIVDGTLWGFAGVSVSLTDLLASFNQHPPVRSGYSFLLDGQQRLVGATPQARLDLAPTDADVGASVVDVTHTGSESLDAALVDMALGGAAVRSVDAKGAAKYLAYRPLDSIDWRVGLVVSVPMVTTIPAQELTGVVHKAAGIAVARTLAVTAAFLLVAMVVGGWISRRLAEPLREMTTVTERVAHGDFSARVAASTGDEIGKLGRCFNAMTDHIEELVRDLERRAAELAGANDALTRQTELLESVLHNMRDGVVGADSDGHVLVWNPACELLLGRRPDRATAGGDVDAGWFLADQTTPAPPDALPLQRAIQGDEADQVEMFIRNDRTPEGAWLSLTSRPLHREDGTLRGGVVVLRDITLTKRVEETLRRANDELDARVKERTAELAEAQRQLIETARSAGMAEVATNVLHNVGNVLNSVNVSTGAIGEQLRASRAPMVRRLADMLKAHEADLAAFLTQTEQGRKLPAYAALLADAIDAERTALLAELAELGKSVEHIGNIVRVQQRYAGGAALLERVSLHDLVDDALRINAAGNVRQHIEIVREIEAEGEVVIDKHKVLQILVNLIANAAQALGRSEASPRRLSVRAKAAPGRGITIEVSDNGVGISEETMAKIFRYGFTTRKDGHGFGLHSSALFAKTMGGSLTARSEGEGKGATFSLELPAAR